MGILKDGKIGNRAIKLGVGEGADCIALWGSEWNEECLLTTNCPPVVC
jgi:hypothetical protein